MCPQAWRNALAAHHTRLPSTRPPTDLAAAVPAAMHDRLVDDAVADRSRVTGQHLVAHVGA